MEQNIYIVSTEDIDFIEEINSLIEKVDHVVKLIHTPSIPKRCLYVYNSKMQSLKLVEKYQECGFE